MHSIRTTIDIAAPITTVWTVLTDLGAYADWNPFITAAEGTVSEGNELSIELTPEGSRSTRMRPAVTVAEAPHTFEWIGSVGTTGIFDGRHRFELEETTTGTKLTHSEVFTGVLAGVVLRFIRARTEAGFVAMNQALKIRAEAHADRLV